MRTNKTEKKKKRPKQYALDLNLRLLLSFFFKGAFVVLRFWKECCFPSLFDYYLAVVEDDHGHWLAKKNKTKTRLLFYFFFWVETKESRQEFSPSKCCVRDKKGDEDNEWHSLCVWRHVCFLLFFFMSQTLADRRDSFRHFPWPIRHLIPILSPFCPLRKDKRQSLLQRRMAALVCPFFFFFVFPPLLLLFCIFSSWKLSKSPPKKVAALRTGLCLFRQPHDHRQMTISIRPSQRKQTGKSSH